MESREDDGRVRDGGSIVLAVRDRRSERESGPRFLKLTGRTCTSVSLIDFGYTLEAPNRGAAMPRSSEHRTTGRRERDSERD